MAMKKFLLVGCGGSGGATLRYVMDQLKADLRVHGISELPKAWQFLHVDVPPSPESPEGIGTIRELGGRYHSVSSPGNSYPLVATAVENALSPGNHLRELAGWAPKDKREAAFVPVTNGAGQYRAIGRMLTLTDLSDIKAAMERAWEELQAPTAWGELPGRLARNYANDVEVVPIVVGSMAGGSGAAMFLDVCRLLGRLPGLNTAHLGVLLFTADVFRGLPQSARIGVDGNALGAIGEILAAQSRASDEADETLFEALGLSRVTMDKAIFGRVMPVGSAIGGDGALFGDGSTAGICRGLGRALAATILSESASEAFVKFKVENPTPISVDRGALGWGVPAGVFPWGSIGYASLSLGRERYREYAAQRLARASVDRLVTGHLNPGSQTPATEQLTTLIDSQWATFLAAVRMPETAADVRGWFGSVAVTEPRSSSEARRASQEAVDMMSGEAPGQASAWVQSIQARLPQFQRGAKERVEQAAYAWAEEWSHDLERAIEAEFVRAVELRGLAYARGLVQRLREHVGPVVDALRVAGAESTQTPLQVDPTAVATAQSLKKTVVGAGHAVADTISKGFEFTARRTFIRGCASLGAEVLAEYATDVLGALEKCANDSLINLERARSSTAVQAGLAQLETTTYTEWPEEGERVPSRFDHADNDVLLTTSAEFAGQFRTDVVASVPQAGGVFENARGEIVGEVVSGRWETAGGRVQEKEILSIGARWRARALPRDSVRQVPTVATTPTYSLAVGTRDLLSRSREHLRRPGQPFDNFCRQSIGDFLERPAVAGGG